MVTIISGTNRSKSNSLKVAKICNEILEDKGIYSQVYSLESLSNDFLFSEMYQDHSENFKKTIAQYIHSAEKIIFVVPEYHGSYSGALKVFLDAISSDDIMDKKTMLVGVASGHAGGIRPLGHLTDVLHHLRAEVFSRKPKLSYIDQLIDDKGEFDQKTVKKLSGNIELFLNY